MTTPTKFNKFETKANKAVQAIMSLVQDGEPHPMADVIVDGFTDDSVRRFINEGVDYGAIRKLVDRSGRQTTDIKITVLGAAWWSDSASKTENVKWWEADFEYPDYWDLYDHPDADSLLSTAEIAECERIKSIIKRRDLEEARALKKQADQRRLPPEAIAAIAAEEDGSISAIDQFTLDHHRKEGEYDIPLKPAHARTYEFDDETGKLVDITDLL